MNEKEYKDLVEKIGKDAADKIKKEMDAYEAKAKETMEALMKQNGYLTQAQYDEQKKSTETAIQAVKDICEKQGKTISELFEKSVTQSVGKSIAQVLKESEDELKSVYRNRMGTKEFLLTYNRKGEPVMTPLFQKAAGTTGSVDGLSGGGSTSSIAQELNAATLLRIGGNSEIISQYRNTPFIFDLVNLISSEYVEGSPMAIWYEEVEKQGSSAEVAQGGTKPLVQYAYKLKSEEYRKEAALVNFTEEWRMDFSRLESDILGKGRTDLYNRVNNAVLGRITAAATAYNTAEQFKGGTAVPMVNDFDAIAAAVAQVENDTYGSVANAAIMSTFKKNRMGITKAEDGTYLNRPDILGNLSFVGNPAMGTDDLLVGALNQYNLMLRGGLIVRVGYNGTDFAENKYSVVLEQFYYDWISAIRAKAIVKGPSFTDIKGLIGA